MSKLDRWDAMARDHEIQFDNNHILDKMGQAALFAMTPAAMAEDKLILGQRRQAAQPQSGTTEGQLCNQPRERKQLSVNDAQRAVCGQNQQGR